MEGKRVPRHGYIIEDTKGNEIGEVTSGTMSPSLEYPIGMGYVSKSCSMSDTEVIIVMRNKKFTAKVVKLPFLKIEK
jgi:aminomethyltransferase